MVSIAIDGPSGAGDLKLLKKLTKDLGYVYVDTGAMYRSIGLYAVRAGADPHDADAVAALLPGAGERCVRALAARCAGPEVRLTCAAENERAMRLYDRLGFSRGAEERVWFSI